MANFASSANGLTVSFTDSSSDSDGSIASRSSDFGDGTSSTAANPSKTYSAAGTYTVKLTVVDNTGASHTPTATVAVGSASGVRCASRKTPASAGVFLCLRVGSHPSCETRPAGRSEAALPPAAPRPKSKCVMRIAGPARDEGSIHLVGASVAYVAC
ncbi:PKD domain-containing protein [Streptomyces sp. NPDC006624]|uniref:PKD domain-containing protein n=1 Tax=Streptomyces sp. NPDC006624 TaxID=3154892 RepID=UPI0033A7A744